MDYKIEIRPLAKIEVIEAYDWYESKKEGLGLEFLNELQYFYETLLRNPFTYSYFEEAVRQGKVNRFPYVVIYEVFDEKIVVYSVFMAKQDPSRKRAM